MSPGLVNRLVVADKIALVQRMLDGIDSLPLADLEAFTADARMVAAGVIGLTIRVIRTAGASRRGLLAFRRVRARSRT